MRKSLGTPREEIAQVGYTCSCCGVYHDEVPTAYGAPAPVYYYALPEEEREVRMQLSEDTAVLDGEHFFIPWAHRSADPRPA